MIKYFYDKIWKKSKGGYTTHSPNRERVNAHHICSLTKETIINEKKLKLMRLFKMQKICGWKKRAVEEGGDVLKTKSRERCSASKGQQALRQTGITGIIYYYKYC
jgi:hypothetical protein